MGIVGSGIIVQFAARLARTLDVFVMAFDPAYPPGHPIWSGTGITPSTNLERVLPAADIIWLDTPESDATRGLLSHERLFSMKNGAVLINTSSPGLVDQAALAESLRGGHLAGAAIDVFSEQFLPAGSPLAGAPNLVLTPRIGGITPKLNARSSALIAERVGDHLVSYCWVKSPRLPSCTLHGLHLTKHPLTKAANAGLI